MHNERENKLPDNEEKETSLPTEPEEVLQWLWINFSEKTVSLTKKQNLTLFVFRSAKERALFLYHAKTNGFQILP